MIERRRAAREAVEIEEHARDVAAHVAAEPERARDLGGDEVGSPVALSDVAAFELDRIGNGRAVAPGQELDRQCVAVVHRVNEHARAQRLRQQIAAERRYRHQLVGLVAPRLPSQGLSRHCRPPLHRLGEEQRSLALPGRACCDPSAVVVPSVEERFAVAVAAQESHEYAKAEAVYREILLSEEHPAVLVNLAQLLGDVGRAEEALPLLGRALELEPERVNTHAQLGRVYEHLGKPAVAILSYERALALDPGHVGAMNNMASACAATGDRERAFSLYTRALKLEPDCEAALVNLGVLLADVGRLSDAIACYRELLRRDPTHASAHCNIANALCKQGRGGEALRHLSEAITLRQDRPLWHSNLLLTLQYLDAIPRESIFAEHQRWARIHCRNPLPPDLGVDRDPHRRLRVGFVSPDFRSHAVAFFTEPLFREHDPEKLEFFAYSNVVSPDAVTARLRGLADGWRDVAGLTDAAFAALVREDRIDVLVDLAGHTAGHRLLTFGLAPAPVQVTYLGYPDTVGVPAVGYRVTDRWCDPPGSERYHVERLLYLEAGLHCYSPPREAPELGAPPRGKNGHITFGSFNNTAKVTSGTIAKWCKVLAALPDARMVMKANTLGDPKTVIVYQELFARGGIDPARVTLLAGTTEHSGHLRAISDVDVVLDAYPYHGTTTTCEALYMGVPVLTRVGDRHVSRVGLSLLTQVGLESFAAHDDDTFVARAVELASLRGAAELAELRYGLRARMLASPLCDGKLKARGLERCLREAWQTWCGSA
ncbi:MAG: tetratricopeptide repeat protein [Myxococcales bacterium]|nr:tetratricopeptide repeat protein [Myxococcales bacterium]